MCSTLGYIRCTGVGLSPYGIYSEIHFAAIGIGSRLIGRSIVRISTIFSFARSFLFFCFRHCVWRKLALRLVLTGPDICFQGHLYLRALTPVPAAYQRLRARRRVLRCCSSGRRFPRPTSRIVSTALSTPVHQSRPRRRRRRGDQKSHLRPTTTKNGLFTN